MKKIILLTIASVALSATAQMSITRTTPPASVLRSMNFSAPAAVEIADPWRIVNGQTQRVDETWVAISGVVAQVHPGEGIRVEGRVEGKYQSSDFFLVNFPYSLASNDSFPPAGIVYLFQPDGVYTYSTAAGSTRTIHKYNYGIPCAAPQLTPKQLASIKAKILAGRKSGSVAALKFDQNLATQGDAFGQLRMAERYRDGDGVETNLLKAKFLLIRSADQGNTTAAKELTALTNTPAAN
jgi:hypothetical protein